MKRRALVACVVALVGATRAAFADDDCGAPKRLAGIDVSSYQGVIDWKRVRRAGVVFAFARISDGRDRGATTQTQAAASPATGGNWGQP
jgi:GH25 family lysozyme M1 (1,4-beta-N-acetylmuramidase)